MWESMKPPWVGSGCSVMRVAAMGPDAGVASSPTSLSPSSVRSSMSSRCAGRMLIDLSSTSANLAPSKAAPTGRVPVASGRGGGLVAENVLNRPRHDVLRIPCYFPAAGRAGVGLVCEAWRGDVVTLAARSRLDARGVAEDALGVKLLV